MKKTCIALSSLIGLCAFDSQAQDSARQQIMEQVVVTATKYPMKTSQTGKVITIISRQQLEEAGSRDLGQILNEQAGIYVNGAQSGPGKDQSIYLRGARIDHTLITIDGVPVYDASGIGGNFDIRNISPEQIERIEILKGSQSTLYGSDALAGVINLISRKSTKSKLQQEWTSAFGSYGTYRGSLNLSGRHEKLDYQASLGSYSSKGIDQVVNTGSDPAEKDGYHQQTLQASFGWQPRPELKIRPFFRLGKISGDLDQGAFVEEMDYTYTQKSLQAGINSQWQLKKGTLNFIYQYNKIDRSYTDDSIKSRNGFNTFSLGLYKGAEQLADFYLGGLQLAEHLKLTAGLDFRTSQSDQYFYSTGAWGPYEESYSKDQLHQQQTGIYTALNWNHPIGLNLEAGTRLNYHSAYGKNQVFNINPSYLLSNQIKLYLNLSSAYRTPSLYQLYSEFGNPKLKPEYALTQEAGLQYESKNHLFNTRATYFERNIRDVHFFFTDPITFSSRYINQDRQKEKGYELEFSYQLAQSTKIQINYSHVNGTITTLKNGKDTTYNNLLRRPKDNFGISVSTSIHKNWKLNLFAQHYGPREDAYFDNQLFTTVNTRLLAYTAIDLGLEYKHKGGKLSIFGELRNALNETITELSGYATMGRNGALGFRLKL